MKKNIYFVSLTINAFVLVGILALLVVKGPSWYVQKFENIFGDKEIAAVTNQLSYDTQLSIFESISDDFEKNQIIFLGDSLTQNANWNELYNHSNILNRGIGGDSTVGILNRIDNILYLEPSKLFIMAGINDFTLGRTVNQTFENYEKIVDTLESNLPATEIYIQSVLPMNNNINGSSVKSESIIDLNEKLKTLSEERDITYVDLYSSFVDEENHLDKKYTIDGTHLNGDGYLIWKDVIQPFVN